MTLEARHQVVLAGGQGRLEGQIIRVGHMGWVDQDDLAAVLRALQVELNSARLANPRQKQFVSSCRLVLVADPIAEEGLALAAATRARPSRQWQIVKRSRASCPMPTRCSCAARRA